MARRDPAADVARIKAMVRHRLDLLVQGLTLELYRRIVFRTPVDTGRARANWQLSQGAPAQGAASLPGWLGGEAKRDAQGRFVGAKRSRARANAIAAGQLAEARSFVRGLSAQEKVFIVNNLVYIRALEHGHSKQAPQGMVAVAVAEVKQMFPGLVRQVRTSVKA